MSRPDAISILVKNQIAALEAHGVAPELAQAEAEERVHRLLDEMAQIGLADVYISVAIRRAHVYRLRCQGLSISEVHDRLGIHKTAIKEDYRHELDRRRGA